MTVTSRPGAARIGAFVDDDGRTWGMSPETRTNRSSVRVLLAFSRRRRLRVRTLFRLYAWAHRMLCLVHSTDFRTKDFGDELYLPHPYGIVVHAWARIGDRVTIYHNVTLGETGTGPGVPTIGDDVLIGAGAVLLGPITVGDGAVIGANAVVTADVPPGGLAVGNPATVTAP